jgi:hypothetical protein
MIGTSGVTEVRENTANSNTVAGFWLQGGTPASVYVNFTGNSSAGNGTGVVVGSINPHRVIANSMVGNEQGLAINWGPSRISQNYVAGNRVGASINGFSNDTPIPSGPFLVRNSFVGNRANGVDVFSGPAGATPTLRENNIFGNGNCGTTNQTTTGGYPGFTLDARNNFWGAATGPSFQNPADEACPGGQPTLTTPFATREFQVR